MKGKYTQMTAAGLTAPGRGVDTRTEALASTAWLAATLPHGNVVVIECSEDPQLYAEGHIPGAHFLNWKRDLREHSSGEFLSPESFSKLAASLGITPDTTVIFYGDNSNWWAAFALWVFQLNGHTRTRLLDGGRAKWFAERRPGVTTVPIRTQSNYPVRDHHCHEALRAGYEETLAHSRAGLPLVDVRSPLEFAGEISHPPEFPDEAAQLAGHIPGACSVPWTLAVTEKGTFKSTAKLREIYEENHGLRHDDDIIVYCRIGERASHTWFVLTQLLGFRRVRNYAGSWSEWSNHSGSPVATVDVSAPPVNPDTIANSFRRS